jgi:hypothetical protein
MITTEAFEKLTKALGARNKIKPLDRELAAYHVTFAADPRDFGAVLTKLKALKAAALAYKRDRPGGPRVAGVDRLLEVIAIEEAVVTPLDQAQNAVALGDKGRWLLKAQEAQIVNQRTHADLRPHFAALLKVVDTEWGKINQALGVSDTTTVDGRALVSEDIDRLKAIARSDKTPGVIRVVLNQILAAGNLQQISPALNMPGAKYNETRTPGQPKYTVNHRLYYDGGASFRLGALVHELTHVAVAEAFGNTVLMFAVERGATDAEWLDVSRSRRAALESLKRMIGDDAELNDSIRAQDMLASNMRIQCEYALGTKVGNYLDTFQAKLVASEGPTFVPRVKALCARGLGSELIEYDSVVNQMLVWCWLNHVTETNAVYRQLGSLAVAAMNRRIRQTKPRVVAPTRPAAAFAAHAHRPLPIPPGRT